MSTKVKERLKKLMLEMTHEERLFLDELLDAVAIKYGVILVKEQKPCDVVIEHIPDDKLIEIVKKIKKKKKKEVEILA